MFGPASIVLRTQADHSACCLQPSFRKLTVRLLTFSASAVVLAPAFCFVCCRDLAPCLACCWLCSFPSFHHFSPACCVCSVGVLFSFFDSAGRFARVLRTYSSAHSAHTDSVLLVSSPIVRRLSSTSCCVRQSGVASFLLNVTTRSVGRVSFSVLCLNSLAAHRDLSHLCAARRLLRAARSSSVTLW